MSNKEQLRQTLDELGISYAPQAGETKLKELLDTYYAEELEKSEAEALAKAEDEMMSSAPTAKVEDETTDAKPLSKQALYKQVRDNALKLVRIRVTCMNPMKKKFKGEIIRVSNRATGDIAKYVPFDGEPYHVPNIIFTALKSRKFQMFEEKTVNTVNGPKKTKVGRLVPEFGIEVLPNLTQAELEALKRDQAARGSID